MRKILEERERLERQQHRRVIFTEILMFLSVILLVGFLTLVVMGYSFNLRGLGGGGEVVERQGLVQISSLPTGATIYIDGEAPLLFSTNASRTMLAGEHEISLARGGFDGWKKTINVTEGMIYRLNYPRLFKEEREKEDVVEFVEKEEKGVIKEVAGDGKTTEATTVGKVSFVTTSPNNERMILLQGETLYMLNLNENKPEQKALALADVNGNVVKITTLTGAEWSGNSERLLAKVNGAWAVIDVRNAKETVWLDEIWAKNVAEQGSKCEESAGVSCAKMAISEIKFENEAGDRLLILSEKKELRELGVRDKKLSEVLVRGVEDFDNDADRVVLLNESGKLMAYRVGEKEGYLITEVEKQAKFATMRYFQESYVGVVRGVKFEVYKKTGWVSGDEEMEKVFEEEVGFEVSAMKKRGKGMVFELAGAGGEDKVFDIEAMKTTSVNASDTGWVDEYLRYRLKEGKLSVLDYDGLNERVLVDSEVLSGRKVVISGNNRWLYYFTSDKKGTEKLVREKIN